jgi:CHAT domain-containing protein/tetratricopeptide (TPR) repeat protein
LQHVFVAKCGHGTTACGALGKSCLVPFVTESKEVELRKGKVPTSGLRCNTHVVVNQEFPKRLRSLERLYRKGNLDPDISVALLEASSALNELSREAAIRFLHAVEQLPPEMLTVDEIRLYLLVATRAGTASHSVLESGLMILRSRSRPALPELQLAACFIAYIPTCLDAGSMPDGLQRRVAQWPLLVVLAYPLTRDELLGLVGSHFHELPDWAIEGSSEVVLRELATGTRDMFHVATAFAASMATRLSPDQALLFHCGGYLRSASESADGSMGLSRLELIYLSASRAIEALLDGAGSNDDLAFSAKLISFHLRELPLLSRLELSRRLLQTVRSRGASKEVVVLLWHQFAEWTSAKSGYAASEELDALSQFLDPNKTGEIEGVGASTVAGIELLRGKLAFREGLLELAKEHAERAVALAPGDASVAAQARVILQAIMPSGGELDAETPYADRLGLSLMAAVRYLHEGDAVRALEVTDEALRFEPPEGSSAAVITRRRLQLLRASALLDLDKVGEGLDEILKASGELVELIRTMPGGVSDSERRDWFAESDALLDRAIQIALYGASNGRPAEYAQLAELWRMVSATRDVELAFHESVRTAWRDGDKTAASYKAAHDLLEVLDLAIPQSIGGLRSYVDAHVKVRRSAHGTEQAASLGRAYVDRLRARLSLTEDSVCQALEEGEVLVEFVSYWTGVSSEDGVDVRALVAFVLHPRRGLVAMFSTSSVEPAKGRLVGVVGDLDSEGTDSWAQPLDLEVLALSLRTVVENFEAKSLIVIPDGPLLEVAVGTLPLEQGHLDDHVLVMLASSTNDLLRDRAVVRTSTPLFISCEEGDSVARGASTSGSFPALTGPGAEIALIASWQESHAIAGKEVTYELLSSIQSPRALHISGHGYYSDPVPEGIRDGLASSIDFLRQRLHTSRLSPLRGIDIPTYSGLALANANEWLLADVDRGIFTAYDFSWIDLRGTEVVVLAGCTTGAGPIERWRGLVDLRRAALTAGAQRVFVALKPVPDVATALLMLLMYRSSMSPDPESLRIAQRKLRNATVAEVSGWLDEWELTAPAFGGKFLAEVLRSPSSHRPFEKPKYWASIVCFTSRDKSKDGAAP